MKLKERIRNRRLEIGMTLEQVAAKVGVATATMQRYESGEIGNIKLTMVEKIANALNCAPGFLLGWNGNVHNASGKLVTIPLLGKIPAGIPMEVIEANAEFIDTPEFEVKDGDYFYLKVVGDSMIGSRIYDGDLVLVRKQPDVESGEIAVVRVNSYDATLKRVKKVDGKVILYPDNPKYNPIIINDSDAEIIGKVVKVEFDPNKKI